MSVGGSTVQAPDRVVVWGNCQAEPIASLLREPLAAQGLHVEAVKPVFLCDTADVARVRELVRRSAYLISQPISDEYAVPGCGTDQLAALLPASGRLVRIPVVFHGGHHPYQVNAHGGDGARVLAPLTDYHDLRAIVAAERGLDVTRALAQWPQPTTEQVRAVQARSLAELQRREASLDVRASGLLDHPDALWTISHPANSVLAALAAALLDLLGCTAGVTAPEREYLGERRAPLEAAVTRALGWPAGCDRANWVVAGRVLSQDEVVGAQLDFYRSRPDVVTDARARFVDRLDLLGLQ